MSRMMWPVPNLVLPSPCHRPRPKEDPEAEPTELQEVQLRMAGLATVEPIMEILREVVGSAATSCESGKLRDTGHPWFWRHFLDKNG